MTRHLFKLVWNRRASNFLVAAEIFVSFLVVFVVMTSAVTVVSNWRAPLGFNWQNVWDVRVDIEIEASPEQNPRIHQTMMRIIDETRSFRQVAAAAGSNTPPYSFSTWSQAGEFNGRRAELISDYVTDEYAEVMGIRVVQGRWFSREDDASSRPVVVLSKTAARALYGEDSPVGRTLQIGPIEDGVVLQVVGVTADYRKDGETTAAGNMIFRRVGRENRFNGVVRHVMLRVRPGTPASFEKVLTDHLQRVAPDMSLHVRRMPQMRLEHLRFRLAPLVLGGVLGLFLISMVTLGLTGVLWQNVTRRTRELGVRRALGASGADVHRQILLEVAVLTTIAVAAGSVVVLQLPLLGMLSMVTSSAFTTGLVGAAGAIYLLTLVCGLYPSWMASRMTPAEALRYE